MPSEEGKQILQLLAEGKIDVEQAYRPCAHLVMSTSARRAHRASLHRLQVLPARGAGSSEFV